MAQNICLLATNLNLGSCTIGGFIDSEISELLDLDYTKEVPLYLIAVGKKA